MEDKKNVLILGAAGRDFHDFLTCYKNKENYKVVGFTQAMDQNLGELDEEIIREFPSKLAGEQYNEPIPIYPENRLERLIKEKDVDEVVFSYSDISHKEVMHKASIALAAGADFKLIGSKQMMLKSKSPIIAIDAVRTGIGKSQVSQKVTNILKEFGYKTIVVREPMPYGDLLKQEIQRFETLEDLEKAEVTVEEREEYEKHLRQGNVVYAGVNYKKILKEVEEEADIIIWEGGNNELPFFKPDLHLVLADPLRAGDEVKYHPGESNLRLADYVLINKENSAEKKEIKEVKNNVERVNSQAKIIHLNSLVEVEDPSLIKDKEVLVIEDGPTLTHGDTKYGAGYVAAKKFGARKIIDPKKGATGEIRKILKKYDDLKNVLPAIGYSDEQVNDLEKTINNLDFDVIVSASPFNLEKIIDTPKPIIKVNYRIKEKNISLKETLSKFIEKTDLD
ncbi:GTPase [archaeon SCG-AAA382B04]|nr:GTPase [archaeon SCG-AAA382B04]